MQTVASTETRRSNGKSGSRREDCTLRGFLLGALLLTLSLPFGVRAGVISTNAIAASRSAGRNAAGVGDILRMQKAGISNDVIKTYIETSPLAYNLSAADIIAMRDHGVPPDIITAALIHDEELRAQTTQAAVQPAPTITTSAPANVPLQGNPPEYSENNPALTYASSLGYAYSSWWYGYPWYSYDYWPYVYSYPYVYPDYSHDHFHGGHGGDHHHHGAGPPSGSPAPGQSGPWLPVVTGRSPGPPPPQAAMYPINPAAEPFNDVSQSIGTKPMTFNDVPQTVGTKPMTFNNVPQTVGAKTMTFNNVPQGVGKATRSFNSVSQTVPTAARTANSASRVVSVVPRAAAPVTRSFNPVRPAASPVRQAVNPASRVVASPARFSAPMPFSMAGRMAPPRPMSVGAGPVARAR